MKWTLREIRDYPEDLMPFATELKVEDQLKAKDSSIISVDFVKVEGYLTALDQAYIMHGTIETQLILPSTRSLQPVEVALTIPIKERYVMAENDVSDDTFEEITIVLDHDYIDLDTVVVDSIIVNLPYRVLGPGEDEADLPSGKDWEVLTQDQYEARLQEEKENHVDPRFAALKTIFKEDQ